LAQLHLVSLRGLKMSGRLANFFFLLQWGWWCFRGKWFVFALDT
jgi:hypothetical protein